MPDPQTAVSREGINMKEPKKLETPEIISVKSERSPYMTKAVYGNYEKSMKEKNIKRKGQGLASIKVRTYEEWSNV